jgi:opacity protein-like surface antigen
MITNHLGKFLLSGCMVLAFTPTYAQSGNWIAGAAAGFAELSSPGNASQGLNKPSPQRPLSYAVYFGHQNPLNFGKNLALGWELKYNNYGTTSYSNGVSSLNYTDDSGDLLLVFSQSFDNHLNYFIEPGIAYVRQKAQLTAPATINGYNFGAGSSEQKKLEPTIAIGLGYQITSHMNAFVAYNHTWGLNESNFNYVNSNGYNNKPFALCSYRAGLSYTF